MTWSDQARSVIARVHAELPADAPLDQRLKAIDVAYPFGERALWPYKAWLAARRAYLKQYGYRPRGDRQTTIFDALARDPDSGRRLL